jgi:hypothetical protein
MTDAASADEGEGAMTTSENSRTAGAVVLRAAIVVLTLATAYIHTTLGGLMFMANAAGYFVLAVAMIAPVAILERNRWLVRAALLGFTIATIVGWIIFGARYWTAYVDKAIEVGLVGLLVIEMLRYDGGPANVLLRVVDLAVTVVRLPFARKTDA